MKRILVLLLFLPVFIFAEPLYSPTWGFYIDLPEGYDYIDGDGRDRFSFEGPEELMLDLVIYDGRYNSMVELVDDVNRRLSNSGDVDFFDYYGKQAAILKLTFGGLDGWGLAVELEQTPSGTTPILLALAYTYAYKRELELFHISALDSIAPSLIFCRYPGPIIEYSYPRGAQRSVLLSNGLNALIYENDAEASQVLIEREFAILTAYLNTDFLQDAWIRYYRFIYRDSFDRIRDAASVIAEHFGGYTAYTDAEKRAYAQRVLTYIQNFQYERDFSGSDFINLVTVVTEGRGDCDNKSMLFAIILANTNIRSALMISPQYGHAMALADLTGSGARFELYGTNWLVAETTDTVEIGLIAQDINNPLHWFGVMFEQ